MLKCSRLFLSHCSAFKCTVYTAVMYSNVLMFDSEVPTLLKNVVLGVVMSGPI